MLGLSHSGWMWSQVKAEERTTLKQEEKKASKLEVRGHGATLPGLGLFDSFFHFHQLLTKIRFLRCLTNCHFGSSAVILENEWPESIICQEFSAM